MRYVHPWVHIEHMTLSERIESQSFAYDPDFPPDVAAGLPLTSACRRTTHEPPLKRALHVWVKVVGRKH